MAQFVVQYINSCYGHIMSNDDFEEITSVENVVDVTSVVFARMTKELDNSKLAPSDAEQIMKDVISIEKMHETTISNSNS